MKTNTLEKGKIVKEGMGGFLNPPTHPEHNWSVQTDLRRRPENRGSMCLSSAVECVWLDPATRSAAKRRLDTWHRPPLESVREWIFQVLGYFRHCYNVTDSEEGWHAGKLTIDADLDPLTYADCHAGVHLIRKYYPDYTPTAADFDGAYWGEQTMTCIRCARCNLPVKVDGEIGKLRLAVPGNHEPTMGEDSALPAETAVCPGSEQLGTVEDFIWVRVGDAGEYESFDSIADALEYLNLLEVGRVITWRTLGFDTPNFWGQDYISIYHGTLDANALGELTADEKAALESGLVKIYA